MRSTEGSAKKWQKTTLLWTGLLWTECSNRKRCSTTGWTSKERWKCVSLPLVLFIWHPYLCEWLETVLKLKRLRRNGGKTCTVKLKFSKTTLRISKENPEKDLSQIRLLRREKTRGSLESQYVAWHKASVRGQSVIWTRSSHSNNNLLLAILEIQLQVSQSWL